MEIEDIKTSGVQTALKINAKTKGRAPLMLVSKAGDSEVVRTCRELNAAGYILKPYQPVFVKYEIERILKGFEA